MIKLDVSCCIKTKPEYKLLINAPLFSHIIYTCLTIWLAITISTGTQVLAQGTVGLQPLGSYANGEIDRIDLASLLVHVDIPLFRHRGRGRGMGVNLHLVYDTNYFAQIGNPSADQGWRLVYTTSTAGTIIVHQDSKEFVPLDCNPGVTHCNAGFTNYSYSFAFTDSTGYTHPFNNGNGATSSSCQGVGPDSCTNVNLSAAGAAYDGSGYSFAVNPNIQSPTPEAVLVTAPSGDVYSWSPNGITLLTDPNGNSGVSNSGVVSPTSAQTFTDSSNISATISGGAYSSTDCTQWTSRAPAQIQYNDTSGNPQTITLNYTKPLVGCSAAFLSSLVYPDGSSYQFGYQATSGQLGSIQLPTGGTITYDMSTLNVTQAPNGYVGLPATLTRTTHDGSTTYSQTAVPTAPYSFYPATSTTNIAKPDGTREAINFVYDLTWDGDAAGDVSTHYETAHTWYSASGTPLKSTMKCYNGASGDCTTTSVALPITEIATSTTLDGLITSQTINYMNVIGLIVETDDYDFGASSPSRKALTQYAPLGYGISDRPANVTVSDTGGNIVSSTTYKYDESALTATSGLSQHSPTTGSRGNLTSKHDWLNTTGATLDRYFTYDDAGQTISVRDPNGYLTKYGYDSSTDSCRTSTTPPTPSSGISQATFASCDPNTGLPTTVTDANGVVTTNTYDAMLRPTGVTVTAGGVVVASRVRSYSGSYLPATIKDTVSAAPSPDEVSTQVFDGLGRTANSTAVSGAEIDVTYNSMGHVQSVSNPYYSTGDPTYGITSYLYDGLGRKTFECEPDNGTTASTTCNPASSYQSWTYSGNAVTFADQAGNQRKIWTDGLGRLTTVQEPNGLSKTPSMETDYGYDVLNNLISVAQWGGPQGSTGARSRTFTYDSLSRLICASNPESSTASCPSAASTSYTAGTTGYVYDSNGNLWSKTDARGETVSYVYDALNRVTVKNQNGAAVDQYFYDGTVGPWAGTGFEGVSPNVVGRLSFTRSYNPSVVGTCNPSTLQCDDEYFGYDPMGRLKHTTYAPPSEWGFDADSIDVTYDLAGNLTSTGYPGQGPSVIQTFDGAGRLSTVSSSAGPYVSSISYLASGAASQIVYGNGVTENFSQNTRLQPCEHNAFVPGTAGGNMVIDKQYLYSSAIGSPCGIAAGNNGNIFQIVDNTNPAQGSSAYTQQFTYDSLNRLKSFDVPTMGGQHRHQDFIYDPFGNILDQTSTVPPAGGGPDPLDFHATYSAANQMNASAFHCLPYINGVATPQGTPGQVSGYDSAGNVLCTGTQNSDAKAMVWDAESRVAELWGQQNNNTYAQSAIYTYDAEGIRIRADQMAATGPNGSPQSQSYKEYWNFGGQTLAEKDQSGVWTYYIYANGQRVARVPEFESVLTISGYNYGTGDYNWFPVINNGGLGQYPVGAGDKLFVRQRQHGFTEGGVQFDTVDANGMNYGIGADQDGQNAAADGTAADTWHQRVFDLSLLAGTSLAQLYVGAPQQNGPGAWSVDFTDMMLFSAASNSWIQIQTEAHPVSLAYFGGSFNGGSTSNVTWTIGQVAATGETATRYYAGDHLGTVQMEFSSGGWPVWKGDFAPFGQELDTQATINHYKFTGKERDTESGLDYFGARYYAAGMGRWTSPDWAATVAPVPYAVLDNPQSLNLYAYVTNNPLRQADPDGHNAATDADERDGAAITASGNYYSTSQPNLGAEQDSSIMAQQLAASTAQQQTAPAPSKPTGNPNLDDAATKALQAQNPTSIKESKEYATRAYKNADGTYSIMPFNPGTQAGSPHGPISGLPAGTTNAALLHTHGSNDPGYDNEHFSPQDIRNAQREGVPSYLATPAGSIQRYDPGPNKVTILVPGSPQ